jgi:hypothetical protein
LRILLTAAAIFVLVTLVVTSNAGYISHVLSVSPLVRGGHHVVKALMGDGEGGGHGIIKAFKSLMGDGEGGGHGIIRAFLALL